MEDGGEKEGAEKGEEDAASEREDDVVSMDLGPYSIEPFLID